MKRRHISETERARIFAAAKGRCHICGEKIDGGRERWDVDHVIALELGGDDHGVNLQPAHEACHKIKTKGDVAAIRKAQRLERRVNGIHRQSRNPLPGGRKSGLKRTINRGTVRREVDQ